MIRVTPWTLALALALPGCHPSRTDPERKPAPAATSRPPSKGPAEKPATLVDGESRELTWHYADSPFGPSEVVVSIPKDASLENRLPVLVAFHGRGESLKGPQAGARGWVDDYSVRRAAERLRSPPLSSADLLGFVEPARLARLNQSLASTAFRDVILVCPYLADALHGARMIEEGRALAGFVADRVLPRVWMETPSLGAAATGVDGVSLGGRAALLVGALRPDAFRAVAALQPAIDTSEVPALAELISRAQAEHPGLVVRLLTSDGDYFLEPTHALHRALDGGKVRHQFDVVAGPHSYDFNRGPGAFEMLVFHDRVLRGLKAP